MRRGNATADELRAARIEITDALKGVEDFGAPLTDAELDAAERVLRKHGITLSRNADVRFPDWPADLRGEYDRSCNTVRLAEGATIGDLFHEVGHATWHAQWSDDQIAAMKKFGLYKQFTEQGAYNYVRGHPEVWTNMTEAERQLHHDSVIKHGGYAWD